MQKVSLSMPSKTPYYCKHFSPETAFVLNAMAGSQVANYATTSSP